MKYVKLTERNENEGETWNFYIPIDGNEEAIFKLRRNIDDYQHEFQSDEYELSDNTYDEDKVIARVEAGDEDVGYMSAHQKLSGKLDLPSDGVLRWKDGDVTDDLLYKGGIKEFMKEQGEMPDFKIDTCSLADSECESCQ